MGDDTLAGVSAERAMQVWGEPATVAKLGANFSRT